MGANVKPGEASDGSFQSMHLVLGEGFGALHSTGPWSIGGMVVSIAALQWWGGPVPPSAP